MTEESQKAVSRNIAGLLGPTLIAIAISEALNLRTLASSTGPSRASLIYLNGTLLFVAGLAIVRVHNRWTGGWPVLVTVIGWFFLFGGLIRMMAPVSAQQADREPAAIYVLLIILFTIGVILTVKAYSRADKKSAV